MLLTNILLLLLSLNSFASLDCAKVDLNLLPDDKISEYTHCFKGAEVTTTETPKVKSKLKYIPVCDRSKPVKLKLEEIFENSCEQITKDMLLVYNGKFIMFAKEYRKPKLGDFSGMNNLEHLALYQSNIENLPTSLFDDLKNLQKLNLGSNLIKIIPEHIFDRLLELKSLTLSGNYIQTLPTRAFDNLASLISLFLGYNKLDEIPIDILDKLPKLEDLSLAGNHIKALQHPIISSPDNSLTNLFLNNNPLTHINNSAFKNMSKLKTLRLNGTNLAIIGNYVFASLKSLEILNISFINSDKSIISEQANEQLLSFDSISLSQFSRIKPFSLKKVDISNSKSLLRNQKFINQLEEKGVNIDY